MSERVLVNFCKKKKIADHLHFKAFIAIVNYAIKSKKDFIVCFEVGGWGGGVAVEMLKTRQVFCLNQKVSQGNGLVEAAHLIGRDFLFLLFFVSQHLGMLSSFISLLRFLLSFFFISVQLIDPHS